MTHTDEQALAALRDYVVRSTHWQEGGNTRHDALLALRHLEQWQSRVKGAELELTAALTYVDEIRDKRTCEVTYETMQRSGFRREAGYHRKYGMRDARAAASCAATRLRNAWQLLDPIK